VGPSTPRIWQHVSELRMSPKFPIARQAGRDLGRLAPDALARLEFGKSHGKRPVFEPHVFEPAAGQRSGETKRIAYPSSLLVLFWFTPPARACADPT